MRNLIWFLVLGLMLLGLLACGGDSANVVPPSRARVSLTTPNVDLSLSGTFQFTASVTGVTSSEIKWSVVGGDRNGRISNTGLYTAPSNAGTYQIIARSGEDPAAEARATIVVANGIFINLAPQSPTVKIGSELQFMATVTGSGNTGVRYSISGQGTTGTITDTGLYTAPNQPGIYEVTATSLADQTRTVKTTINVVPGVDVRIKSPTPNINALVRSRLKFTARVTGTSNTTVNWSVLQANGGTIDANGVYLAPTTPGTYTVRATTAADANVIAQQSVVVLDQVQVKVTIRDKGEFVLKLAEGTAPRHCANLVSLTNEGFYDNIVIHRYEPGFVVQMGDPLTKTLPLDDPQVGTGGPGYTIDFEPNPLLHKRYALGMARSTNPNSAGSQWYICLDDLPSLDGSYVVFGDVTSGRSVVDSLRRGDVITSMRVEPVSP